MTEMPEEEILLPADEPPASGEWVDIDEVIANPTDEEVAEGETEGLEVDPEDDFDGSEFDADDDEEEDGSEFDYELDDDFVEDYDV